MANEAVIIELLGNGGDPVSMTVGDGAAIEKGALLWFTEPRTVSGSALSIRATQPFAGIAAHEKVASDGSTTISVYTNGIFDLTNDSTGTITAGWPVVLTGANLIMQPATTDLSGAYIVGVALEDAATSEVIAVRIKGLSA